MTPSAAAVRLSQAIANDDRLTRLKIGSDIGWMQAMIDAEYAPLIETCEAFIGLYETSQGWPSADRIASARAALRQIKGSE